MRFLLFLGILLFLFNQITPYLYRLCLTLCMNTTYMEYVK